MAVDRERLTDRRDELDLSNQELAARAGIKEGYLRNIVSGYGRGPSRRVRYSLERALRLPKDALLVSGPDEEEEHEHTDAGSGPPNRDDPTGPGRIRDEMAEAS